MTLASAILRAAQWARYVASALWLTK